MTIFNGIISETMGVFMKFFILTTFLYFVGSYINVTDEAVNQFVGGILSVFSSLLLLSCYFIVIRGSIRMVRGKAYQNING